MGCCAFGGRGTFDTAPNTLCAQSPRTVRRAQHRLDSSINSCSKKMQSCAHRLRASLVQAQTQALTQRRSQEEPHLSRKHLQKHLSNPTKGQRIDSLKICFKTHNLTEHR